MTLFDSVRADLAGLVQTARDRVAADSLGMLERVKQVMLPLIPEAMQVLERTAASGQSKKAAVLAFLSELYDRDISKINVPGPFDRFVHMAAKKLLLVAADKLIDGFAAFLKSPNAASIVASFQPPAAPPATAAAA